MDERLLTMDRLEGFLRQLCREERARGTVEKYRRDLGAFAAWLEGRSVTAEAAAAWKERLLASGVPATAVVAGSDSYAMGALQAFQENGLRVPEDISLIGLDDSYAAVSLPAMSTLAFPMDDAAATAVAMIQEQGRDSVSSLRHTTFGLKMILRSSTQKKRTVR